MREKTENGIEKYTVPPFFNNFVIEPGKGNPPYIRVRLEATWQRSNQPEGIVETNLYFVTAPESTPLSPQNKRPISQTQISQTKIIYGDLFNVLTLIVKSKCLSQ